MAMTDRPASPARKPDKPKAVILSRLTGRPDRIAARSLKPIAMSPCPVTVKRMKAQRRMAHRTASQNTTGNVRNWTWKSQDTSSRFDVT